jgi:Na+/citrate or Na+/malate symporter
VVLVVVWCVTLGNRRHTILELLFCCMAPPLLHAWYGMACACACVCVCGLVVRRAVKVAVGVVVVGVLSGGNGLDGYLVGMVTPM